MSKNNLHVNAPTISLLASMENAGWGDLAGREFHGLRAALRGLAQSLPWGSSAGYVTVADVAFRAGYSERWTALQLYRLEDLGLLQWDRGGVLRGTPVRGYMRIVKSVLIELIKAARPAGDAHRAAQRAATRARIAHLRYVRWSPVGKSARSRTRKATPDTQNRRSAQPELSAYLRSAKAGVPGRSSGPGAPASPQLPPPSSDRAGKAAAVRAEIRRTRRPG